MLHYLKAKNFGPHEEFFQEFSPGLTLILGPNGVGKSNLLYGIGWSIMGTKALPSEYVQQDIIRDGSKSVESEVCLDLLGSPHIFYRSYDGQSVQAEIFLETTESDPIASTASGVKQYLDDLGVSWDSASVLFSRQRELDAFVYATPSSRKLIFDALLRTEGVDRARSLARKTAREYDVARSDILDIDISEVEKDVIKQKKSLKRLTKNISTAKSRLSELREKRDELSARIEPQDPDLITRLKNQIQEVQRKEARLLEQKSSFENLISGLLDETELKKTRRQIRRLTKQAEQAQNWLDESVESCNDHYETLAHLRGHEQAAKTTADKIKSGRCPVCLTEFDDVDAHIARIHGSISEIQQEIDDAEELIVGLEKETKEASDEVERLTLLKHELAEKIEVHDNAKKAAEELEKLESKLQRLSAKLDALNAGLDEATIPVGADLLLDLKDTENEITSVLDIIRVDGQKHDDMEMKRRENADLIQRYHNMKTEYEEGIAMNRLWADTTKHLTNFRDLVLCDALDWVSKRATQLVRSIGTLSDATPDSELELDTDLNFWFVDGDSRRPVYRFSGGQKAVFALCLRIALSDYFSSRLGLRGFLLLDAVLDSLDEDNRAATAAALESSGPSQAIIFSHFDVPDLTAKRVWL